MSRDPALFLDDIIGRTTRITALARNRSIEDFQTDDALHESILRHLTVIGEAVKNLPEELPVAEPSIPWRRVPRMRDLLIHVYFGVKDEIILQTVLDDVVPLRLAEQRLLARLTNG